MDFRRYPFGKFLVAGQPGCSRHRGGPDPYRLPSRVVGAAGRVVVVGRAAVGRQARPGADRRRPDRAPRAERRSRWAGVAIPASSWSAHNDI